MTAALVQICANRDCSNAPTATVSYGCVHEHLELDVPVCTRCLALLRRLVPLDQFVCTRCEEAGYRAPHRIIRDGST